MKNLTCCSVGVVCVPADGVRCRPAGMGESGVAQRCGLYVVQFDSPLIEADNDALARSGLTYLGYLPYNAALVVGTQSQIGLIAQEPNVQWTSLYQPAFRSQPAAPSNPSEEDDYIVQVADVPGNESLVQFVRRASLTAVNTIDVGPFLNLHAVERPARRRLPGRTAIRTSPGAAAAERSTAASNPTFSRQ